jgi:hypothetical protein
VREDTEFKKGIDLGFNKLRQGGPDQPILERGLNPTQDERGGCSIPFGLAGNLVLDSGGGVY